MPLTFMLYFYIGANARWLMSATEWPDTPEYRGMMAKFRAAFTRLSSGTRSTDFVPFDVAMGNGSGDTALPSYDERKEVRLSRQTYDALLELLVSQGSSFTSYDAPTTDTRPNLHNCAQFIPSIRREYMTFASRTGGRRDSYVLFTDPLHPLQEDFPRAGQISQIFLHARLEHQQLVVEPFVLIDEYQPLTGDDVAHDPYRSFADLDTRLFYHKHATPRVVRLKDVRCHFAALVTRVEGVHEECIVVRSLDRVSIHSKIDSR